jgi:hypothetical protein
MATPQQWLKTIYLAKKTSSTRDYEGNEIATYSAPIPYEINHQPASGDSDIQMYGARILQIQKAFVDKDKFNNIFSEFDKVYLDGINPTGELINGSKANYRVQAVLKQNKKILVYFERLNSK